MAAKNSARRVAGAQGRAPKHEHSSAIGALCLYASSCLPWNFWNFAGDLTISMASWNGGERLIILSVPTQHSE